MSKNNKIIVGFVVACLAIVAIGIIISVRKEQSIHANRNNNIKTPGQNSEYQKVEVADLYFKLSKLDFDEKTVDSYIVDKEETDYTVKVENGRVLVSYKMATKIDKAYEVANITNAYSAKLIYSGQGKGAAVIYILTTDGKVYKIYDDFADLNNVGNAIDLKAIDASEMAVSTMTFKDEAIGAYPTVIIKTKDGKYLTDDSNLTGKNSLVEVVEAKQVINYNHETVKVSNLDSKLSKLDFNNRNESFFKLKEEKVELTARCTQGYVSVYYNYGSIKEGYEVYHMSNAVTAKITYSAQGNGAAVTYILTNDGKVFKIFDDFSDPKNFGRTVELNVKNAKSIAVGNMTLKDNAYASYPTVVIKTDDNKVLTDDPNLATDKSLVEVVDNTAKYDKVSVSNLDKKLSKLDFDNTRQSIYKADESEPELRVNVEQGYVAVYYKLASDNKGYEVPNMTSAVTAKITYSAQGSGGAVSYILTNDGKVYRLYDDFANLDDVGNLEELNVKNAKSIAVGNITLKDNAPLSYPSVVIKTTDNKVLTDDPNLTSNHVLVEVVNK